MFCDYSKLVPFYKISEVHLHLLVGNERLTTGSRCRQHQKAYRLFFLIQPMKSLICGVINQWNHWFVALSLSLLPSFLCTDVSGMKCTWSVIDNKRDWWFLWIGIPSTKLSNSAKQSNGIYQRISNCGEPKSWLSSAHNHSLRWLRHASLSSIHRFSLIAVPGWVRWTMRSVVNEECGNKQKGV